MYLDHFGLAVNPFGLSPKLDFLYKSKAFEESIAHLVYGLDQGEAIIMISGPIGSGKTMALQSFMTNLGPRYDFALVTNTQVTPVELIKLILEDLDVTFPLGCDKSDLLILFKAYLLDARLKGRHVVIIIDEAQNLSLEVLEEVRLLTNLGQGDAQPVQIVLVGQPELEHIVNDAKLAQLRQRIRVHYSVEALDRKEIGAYLTRRLSVAGCRKSVFSDKAVTRIFELSGGVPRVVNTLAGEALLSAYVAGRSVVSTEDVGPEPGQDQDRGGIRPEATGAGMSLGGQRPDDASPAAPSIDRPVQFARKRRGRRTSGVVVVAAVTALLAFLAVVAVFDLGGAMTWLQRQIDRPYHLVSEPSPQSIQVVTPVAARDTSSGLAVVDTVAVAAVPIEQEKVVPKTAVAEELQVGYLVHVASFRDEARSEAYMAKLHKGGLPVAARTKMLNGVLWHRVCLGPYESKAAATSVIDARKDALGIGFYQIITEK